MWIWGEPSVSRVCPDMAIPGHIGAKSQARPAETATLASRDGEKRVLLWGY